MFALFVNADGGQISSQLVTGGNLRMLLNDVLLQQTQGMLAHSDIYLACRRNNCSSQINSNFKQQLYWNVRFDVHAESIIQQGLVLHRTETGSLWWIGYTCLMRRGRETKITS